MMVQTWFLGRLVPREVGYKDKTKELTNVMPTIENFEVFPDSLLLDLERDGIVHAGINLG